MAGQTPELPVTRPTHRSLDDSSMSKIRLIIVSTKAIISTMALLVAGPTKATMALLGKGT